MAWRHVNDTTAQMTNAFKGIPVTGRIVGWNVNVAPATADRSSKYLYPFLMCSSIGDALSVGKSHDLPYIFSIAVANCMAPGVQEMALSQANARKLFTTNGLHFLHHSARGNRLCPALTAGNWADDILGLAAPNTPAATTYATLSTEGFLGSDQYAALVTDNAYVWIAHVILNMCKRTTINLIRNAALHVYVNAFLSFSKRGTVTDAKLDRIIEQIQLETDTALITEDRVIAMIYASLGSYIDENNARLIFEEWSRNCTGLSLRMQITLQQSSGSGLTTYSAIRQAVYLFGDFPWGRVMGLLPIEIKNFQRALDVISDNMYFGFSKRMSEYGSTKYKSLGYVAKELLKALGGPDFANLARANCWTRNPLHKALLDDLINAYVHRDAAQHPAASNEDVDLFKAMVKATFAAEEAEDDVHGGNVPADDDAQ
ncbi:nucleocapsid protein [dermapteran chu-related virus 142]|uniref:Nucleocapsid protein n=1 Tax=dermapteran chu-related virus 142 TaxID=2849726 RepID=A0A7D7EY48_9VIRU|nr:nucleocapsid protein [dermapteran chu-related virus 142]QMP82283.1 nucleocapsid protein [dermapteran chu-related virus 142]